jgi:HPt (histidine-containing phosphotransfer) domain-containing protein
MATIDWEQFDANFQYYDKEIIFDVIENFFEECEERLNTIEKNIAENDLNQLSFNAHSMKSVIGNFMAPAPHELCRRIEELAKQNSSEGVPLLFSELKRLTYEMTDELKEYLQK